MQRSNEETEAESREATPAPYYLEEMRAGDLERVVALERECGLNSRGLDKYRTGLADPREVLLVAVERASIADRRELVGLVSGMVVIDELQIDNLAVATGWRRLGVGSHLLREAMVRAHRNGATRIVLELRSRNTAALALYRRQGLEVNGKRISYYVDPPDDALLMTGQIERLITNWKPQN